ncbi:MAG: protein phosphatase 2C domain-containing protein [bacterium]|nr:protein phosphatase 2C domain-containing protein [bacterium]
MGRVWCGSAAKPGPTHYNRRKNCQDMVFSFRRDKMIVASVADGCSASSKSEAGAAQLCHAATQAMWQLVKLGVSWDIFPGAYDRLLQRYLMNAIAAYPGGAQFLSELTVYDRAVDLMESDNYLVYAAIAEMYQATVLGVCVHEDEGGLVLVRGDAKVSLDGKLSIFDYNDMPPYLGYMLAIKGQEYPGDPADLHSKVIRVPPNFQKLGVTTDGWPWHHAPANPFGRWKWRKFETWLLDLNNRREDEDLTILSSDDAWNVYHPEEVDDLARLLVKKNTMPDGSVIFDDDISGVFIEREVT